ncbi:Electron transfer flavoprotein beta subunit lysine methyltransferase [Gaertneriomyces sp. JEL0708]|nr:Electron transfer flavoprotein beta subunit lysine methyltransferase [Gaertneriomyces sp. JEL0708]
MWTWGEHEMEVHGISPFWAIYWPGGQALTQYILQTPSVVRHKRILDLGAGCGSATVASLLHTADHVLANDIDPYALTAVQLNTELNNLPTDKFTLSSKDLLSASVVPDVDVAFVGDMFYDGDMARRMTAWVETARKRGVEVLIGDPGRWAFETQDVQHSVGKERREMNGLVLEKVHEVRLDKEEEHLQEREFERGIVWRVV